MPEADTPHPDLVAAAEGLVAGRGPLTVEALAEALAGQGADLGDHPVDFVEEVVLDAIDTLYLLPDERLVHLPTLLTGRIFTHRVSALEVAHDVLVLDPDLAPLEVLGDLPGHARMADGTAWRVVYPLSLDGDTAARPLPAELRTGETLLEVPPGTLASAGLAAGDLAGLRLTAEGLMPVRLGADPTAAAAAALRQPAIDLLNTEPNRPAQLDDTMLALLADHPDAFVEPQPPLEELLTSWELAIWEDLVAAPGFSFARWRAEQEVHQLERAYGLESDQALALVVLLTLEDRMAQMVEALRAAGADGTDLDQAVAAGVVPPPPSGADDADLYRAAGTVHPAVAEPAVADALLQETFTRGPTSAAALGLMVEALEQMAERRARPALRWLRARAHELAGDVTTAEQELLAAERLDPAWPLTVLDLARYASDRGDAVKAHALLRRVPGDPDPDFRRTLEAFLPKPGPQLGRNQPCWCGSGRKFKQCHLNRTELPPLPERATWLYAKAAMFVTGSEWLGLARELVLERARFARNYAELAQLSSDPLVIDAVLFEGGALEDFVETRGVLLPADELLLAQQWLLTERSVFEVTDVVPGRSLTLRDLRSGDVQVAAESTVSRELASGTLLCTHLLPVGDELRIFGGLSTIQLHERDALLELLDDTPDPEEVVAFLSRRHAPVTLVNTAGDPLMLCEATLHTPDPDRLRAALDDTYDHEGAEPSTWLHLREIDGLDRICATLRLAGEELTVSTNSAARMDDTLATLRQLEPGIEVRTDRRTPARTSEEVAELARNRPARPEAATDLAESPEAQEALGNIIRQYEERWLDLPIPALAGHTPREAADDPTRRPDLLRLLDTFPDRDDDPTGMSPGRIRAALGLRASA